MAIAPSLSTCELPELLAPAGDWDCAKAAVENGADAIYFGLERFNARMRAQNFTEAELPELMAFLHRRGVKGYVTLNTLVFTEELPAAERYLKAVMAAGVDAAIVQDVGICRLIRHLSPDFPIHASTQMTVTSAAGVEFARALGCQLVVLARECSLKDISKIKAQLADRGQALPLEVFVHGALCVAYSGQCLTSEALGGRSANRGECAQACRMPYDLIVDGEKRDLGDRRYLLSPQDLAGLDVLPELVQSGVTSLKIEGRLKTPEYVASVTQVYRRALDRVAQQQIPNHDGDRYNLEMAFSRGLYTGWFRGINNQELVHARFGKKRGVYLGEVLRVLPGRDSQVVINLQAPLKPGDGIVFDRGNPQATEVGGRVYAVELHGTRAIVSLGRRDVDVRHIHPGDKVWKTSDPEWERQVRQSFAGEHPHIQSPIDLDVHGTVGHPLTVVVHDSEGHTVQVESAMSLVEAHTQGLTLDRLQAQLARLGGTPFRLGTLTNHLQGSVMLPVSELNRLRRDYVAKLETLRSQPKRWQCHTTAKFQDLLPDSGCDRPQSETTLIVLVRHLEQLQAALTAGISTIYCELEDPCAYRKAVQQGRSASQPTAIWVAPPRITKPSEHYILQQVARCEADGYLVRNYDHLRFFQGQPMIGDFSLNVANPLTAAYFKSFGLTRLTASYDLNATQLAALIRACPANWLEVTIHQHMPMFHMEHCVFCAFLSEGTDYTNCGRPCDRHQVQLRDRVGVLHPLKADAGCRNTLFNGTAQTGAEYVQMLVELGLRHLRLEFVDEPAPLVATTIAHYQQLLQKTLGGAQLWQTLKLDRQLGVTRGPLDSRGDR